MKKLMVLSLFGLLIMALTGTVYAQKLDFRASGFITLDTVVEQNVPFYFGQVAAAGARSIGTIAQTWSTPAGGFYWSTTSSLYLNGRETGSWNKNAAYMASRAHLKFDAVMDKNLSGTIYFEIDAMRYGGSAGSAGGPGGYLTQAADKNNFACWTTDKAAVEIKNIYFDVGVPYFGIPVPMTVRIGAQPLVVRPQIMLYSDAPGITGGIKIDPVMIMPMWAKVGEFSDYAADDIDFYGLHVNAKVGKFSVGGYGLFYNMNTYPLGYGTGVTWPTAMSGGGAFPATAATSASYGLLMAGTQSAKMWWFGAYADGKAGPVDLNFDFVLDTGSVHERLTPNIPDVRYQGWATRLNVNYPFSKFNFGATGMYATGADLNRTSAFGQPGQPVLSIAKGTTNGFLSNRVSSFVLPIGSEQPPIGNESLVVYSCFNSGEADGGTGIANTGSYGQLHRGSYGGTWFAKLYGSVKPTPWYKITLQGLYIGDTTKHGNTFGTAQKNIGFASRAWRDDNDIGWELDLIQEIDIYKNLKGWVGFGYLFAGQALDVWNTSSSLAAPNTYGNANVSPKNPWNFTTRLLYTF
jgi:hypothetical protein